MIFERRLSYHLDWALLGAILALAGMGLMMIYSTTFDLGSNRAGREFWTQSQALVLALIAMVVCLSIDYRSLTQRSLFIYGGILLLLVAVFFVGVVRGGSRRWIPLGFFNLQPSEFGRIAVALVLAMYFGENRRGARMTSDLFVGAAFTLVPFLLIARQPDLGTAATLLPVYLGIAYLAGLRMRLLVVAAVIGILLSPVAWTYALKPYQKERIQTFLDPERDPRGAGYQQIQARVTVGSGGLTGKGFRQGTQGGYGFLPVAHNDFVFSVLAEEHGFLGVLVARRLDEGADLTTAFRETVRRFEGSVAIAAAAVAPALTDATTKNGRRRPSTPPRDRRNSCRYSLSRMKPKKLAPASAKARIPAAIPAAAVRTPGAAFEMASDTVGASAARTPPGAATRKSHDRRTEPQRVSRRASRRSARLRRLLIRRHLSFSSQQLGEAHIGGFAVRLGWY